jgi:L-rhamnose isomerase
MFGLHDNLNKNINFGQHLNFALEVNRFINELKQIYPNVPNFSNVFFQQELYIIEKIYHALIDY